MEDEVITRTRRRLRRPGGSPIAEVGWRRSSQKGRDAVRSFGVDVEEADLDIELLELEDETEVTPTATVSTTTVREKAKKVKAKKPDRAIPPFNTAPPVPPTPPAPKPQNKAAAEALALLSENFPVLPFNDEVEDAVIVWVAATTLLIKTIEASK